jgi:hypothetical protein
MLNPWLLPGHSWETTDIWIDGPLNGYSDKGVYTEKNYRYGVKTEAGQVLPAGNGDDPVVGQINRIYSRVRNVGGKEAKNVVVHFEITDPVGLGVTGKWKPLGTATVANIKPGSYADVYVEWTPDFPISQDELKAGRFAKHSCIRVRIDPVAEETVLDNQDGDGEQENIGYFQASASTGGPGPDRMESSLSELKSPQASSDSEYANVIYLHNDDSIKQTFFLNYKSDLPNNWILNLNNGVSNIDLDPDEVRDIPISIQTKGFIPVGSIFGVDMSASIRLNPNDPNSELKTIGGVRIEARGLLPTSISCNAERQLATQISVKGKLEGFESFYDPVNPLRVMIEGVDNSRKFLSDTIMLVDIAPDGSFTGNLAVPNPEKVREATCIFAGNTKLASSASGYTPITGKGIVYGIKFNDLNGNGIKDAGESGLNGWTITLNSNGNTFSTSTGANGGYMFDGLAAGDYTVGEIPQSGWIQTTPTTGTYTLALSSGQIVTGNDFGNFKLGEIHGMKWEDLNVNGKKDLSEKGLAGWKISIKGTDTITGKDVYITTTTDSNGNYHFTGLTAGTYTISEELKSGWIQTAPAKGNYIVNIISGSNIAGQDFGNFHKGKITGGGWIKITGDPKATFGIVGQYPDNKNTANGNVEYQDHKANLNIKSIQINTVATTWDKKKGVITGLVKVNGAGSYPFEVYVEDNGEPGKGVDVFRINLPTYPYSDGAVLNGGNIQIHS